jgi:hypothetical protein
MNNVGWDVIVSSDPEHERLISEVSFDGELIMTLDAEEGYAYEKLKITLVNYGGDLLPKRST